MAPNDIWSTLVGDGVAEFEMAVACEVFGYDRSAEAGGRPWYRHVLAAAGPDVRTMHGMRVDPEPGLAALRKADTIVVAPWKDSRVTVPDDVITALQAAHRRGARLLSLCTGRVCSRCYRTTRRSPGHHALGLRRRVRSPLPRRQGRPQRALCRRRRDL